MTKSRKPRGPKEEALRAAREDDLAIPAILRRKPETPEQEAARVKKQAKEDRHNRFAESAGLKIIEPMDPKIRKAIEKEFRDPADVFVEPPKKIPAKKMPRALQKALAERDKLEAKAKPEHSAKATKQESEMRKSAKATSKPAPKKGQGPSKRDIVVDMVCSKGGTTCAEACKKIGWSVLNRSTLLAYCKAQGVTVKTEAGKDGKPDRYFGTRKAAKQAA